MSETLEVTVDDVVDAALAEPAPAKFRLLAFSNDTSNTAVLKQLEMYYELAFNNQIGIMHARNDETQEIETLLVGIGLGVDGGVETYPIARILGENDVNLYSPPDGDGGYLSDAVTEH